MQFWTNFSWKPCLVLRSVPFLIHQCQAQLMLISKSKVWLVISGYIKDGYSHKPPVSSVFDGYSHKDLRKHIRKPFIREKRLPPHFLWCLWPHLGILLFRKCWWFSQSPRESSHGDQRLKGGIAWKNPSPWNISQVSPSKAKGTKDQYYLQKEYFTLLAKRELCFTCTTLSSWNYHLYQSLPGRTWFSVLH